jgi:hypothetical protein
MGFLKNVHATYYYKRHNLSTMTSISGIFGNYCQPYLENSFSSGHHNLTGHTQNWRKPSWSRAKNKLDHT